MIKKIVLKPRMSALNYEFLAQPTQMEGRNFYCDIKVCHKIPGGGALGYFLGGYVPPGTPNWHPVLEKISSKIDTPF